MTAGSWGSRRDRGAVVVETAIVAPLLILLLVGLGEIGVAWRADNQATDGLRDTMVQAARSGSDRAADIDILETIAASVAPADTIEWVIVYKTASGTTAPPPACVAVATSLASGSSGIADTCNAYHGTFVKAVPVSDFLNDDCTDDPDQWLCPTGRRSSFSTSDRLGVAYRFHHSWFLGLLPGGGITLDDHAVTPLLTGVGDLP